MDVQTGLAVVRMSKDWPAMRPEGASADVRWDTELGLTVS